MVAQGVGLHDLHGLQLLQAGLLRDLVLAFVGVVLQVPDVRDVADVTHLVAQVAEQFAQHIVGHARAGMAEMGVAVDGRAADIHAYVAGVDRLEQLFASGQGIGDEEVAHGLFWK